jgi:hypothetical protein
MQQYQKTLAQGIEFLDQHDALLQSLTLSKQNTGNNVYTDKETQGISNGTEQSSQGINYSSNEQLT